MGIKQCEHKNQICLTSMPPQFKCADCGYTIEPSKKIKKKDEPLIKPTKRDWVEDFEHENGNYMNLCCRCNESFSGHKRRNICRICAGQSVKKPTGILKDLSELKRYSVFPSSKVIEGNKNGNIVRWSDVEAIINKYMNP